jgi:hypothetical protein
VAGHQTEEGGLRDVAGGELGAEVAEDTGRHADVLLEQSEQRLIRLAGLVHLHRGNAKPFLVDLRRVRGVRARDASAHVRLVADGRRKGQALALVEDRLEDEHVRDVHAALERVVEAVHVARVHAVAEPGDGRRERVRERREVRGKRQPLARWSARSRRRRMSSSPCCP